MITLNVDIGQIKRLEQSLGDKARRLPRELQTAVNAVAKKVAADTAKDLSRIMPLKQATLRKIVKQKGKAKADSLKAIVGIGEGYNIPLKFFKPKEIKRTVTRTIKGKKTKLTVVRGVTVQLRKKVKRNVISEAFLVKRWGDRVYKRKGEDRGPLEQLYGPKPGDFFAELGTVNKAVALANTELTKQIERRIRFNLLKAQGII